MWRLLANLIRRLDIVRYRRAIERALALHLRGEVRSDGLKLKHFTTRLEIEWRARDIHPWDRELVSDRESRVLILEQSLTDTEAAIFRIFAALPVIDVLDIAVLDHTSDSVIIAGHVDRSMLGKGRNVLSILMHLRELGVTHFADREFSRSA